MSLRDDWSWSAEALYACPCGALVTAQRWRWIDADARPDAAARLRAAGPLSGACPRCRRAVAGGGVWLEVAPSRQTATLILSADRRGDLIAALQAHLADVQARAERAAPWLIQPAVAFASAAAEGEEARPTVQGWPGGQVELRPGIVLGPRAAEVASARVDVRAREGEGRGPEEPPDLDSVAPPRDRAAGAGAGGQEARSAGQGAADRADSSGSFRQVAADRAESSGTFRQVAADRAESSGTFRQVEPQRREGSGPTPSATVEPPRREGSGPTPSATIEPRRRENSGPTPSATVEPRRREGSGPVIAAPAGDGRARQGRPPSRGVEEAPKGEKALDDTFPGRKARRPEGEADAPGPRRAAGDRRPGQDPGDMSRGRAEHHDAIEIVHEHEDAPPRRGGQDHEDMSRRAGEGEEAGEGASLRAAVARALSPAPTGPARRDEGAGRPAAVLPAPRGVTRAEPEPREEPADSEQSGSTWSKRQVSEAEAHRPRARASDQPPPAPPARLTAEVQRQSLASLGREGGGVQVTATLNDVTARVWSSAPIRVRPIHLRGLGYPLVGVRCVAEAGGESLVIDAVVDIGEPATTDIFKHLAREFKLRLVVRSEGGTASRELVAPEYQRNAASCLESAQQQLGTGEFPPDAYRTAREVLAARTAGQRLEPVRNALSEEMVESCRTSAGAAWAALERLDQASRKDNLARMTEVDGLPIEQYEAIRSAVLAAAVEFGLPAPARFWRRWLASEQARDIGVFVQRLVAARAASVARGEDLAPEAAEAAWRGLYDLCQHKDLTPPPELAKALGLGRSGAARRSSQAPVVVSGEIRASSEAPRGKAPRLKDLMSRLQGSPSEGDIRAVIAALPELAEDDVAGLLPALAELGPRVAPELGPSLRAPQRWVRQAAAILLGHIGDRKAEPPLLQMLGEEPTAAWVDAARALGNFGPRVVGPLCSVLRGAPAGRRDVLVPRVARALAELVKAEGSAPDSPGRQAVENLLDVGDVAVSTAARRALATLGAVRDEVAGDDAEAARRFSQLASDAITAPEVDAFADDEIDELDVEVGDD